MFEFLAFVFAIIAFTTYRTLRRRVDDMAARLAAAEASAKRLQGDVIQLREAAGLPRSAEGESPVPPAPSDETSEQPSGETAGAAREDIEEDRAGEGTVPPVAPDPDAAPATPALPPPTPISLEERLGTRWAVWVGGLALGLGGLLLVRYSIEQGFFGPGARVIMGLLLSAALVAAGEWFRRSERALVIEAIPSAHIPGILTAAGTATAFGAVYAAHALYGFIGPAATFVLLGLIGIATMLAAALHGPALAGLGLAGSYVAPLLVSSDRPNPWPVVIYLAVVASAAIGLARLRRWLWLAWLVVAGAVLWGLIILDQAGPNAAEWTLAAYLHTVIQLALAAAFIAIEPHLTTRDDEAHPDWVASVALTTLGVLAMTAIGQSWQQDAGWILFALATLALLLFTAYRAAPAAAAAVVAGAVTLAVGLSWRGLSAPPEPQYLWPAVADILRLPENISSYLTTVALLSLGIAAVATGRLHLGRLLPAATSACLALAATMTPLLVLVVAYLRVTQFDHSIPFAVTGAALACLFAVVADRFQRIEIAELAGTRLATGAFAAAAIVAFSFALVAALDRGYLTVALALGAAGTAYVAVLKDIPMLRHVVTAFGLLVLGRVIWEPRIMGDGVGSWPIINWLLLGYGVPTVSFWASARILETKGTNVAVRIADAIAVLFAGLLCFYQIHHMLNGGDVLAPTTGYVEQGLLALLAIGFSHALMRLDLGRANPVFRVASIVFGVISGILIVVGLCLAENPLLSSARVAGPPVFSSLMLAYLLPGIGAVLLARASRPHRPRWYVTAIAVLAALLVFSYVTLEVRHVFQGERIDIFRSTGAAEVWAYSAAWLALGVLFLAYGIWRSSLEARLASAVLVLLSVLKVFLLDLGGITGFWRALSFIVLGLVLIAIGLAYQNLVFGKRPKAPDRAAAPSDPGPGA